jgi:hypothetical protein
LTAIDEGALPQLAELELYCNNRNLHKLLFEAMRKGAMPLLRVSRRTKMERQGKLQRGYRKWRKACVQ